MEDFFEYLPGLRNCSSSSVPQLSWPPKLRQILRKFKKGKFHTPKQLVVAISYLRHTLYAPNEPLSKNAMRGFLRFFDEVMPRREFNEVVPALAKLLLKLPSLLNAHYRNAKMDVRGDGVMVTTALRMLNPHQPGIVCLSQELIAALLACSLFCLFPDSLRRRYDLPLVNFDRLFAGLYEHHTIVDENKIWCILHYFERISSDMPKGIVSFERRAYTTDANSWSNSSTSLCKFEVHSSGLIEDQSSRAVEVYFADKLFGGYALVNNPSLEEVRRFMFSPELIAGMLFSPAMKDNEVIEIVGAERFSTYTGFKSSFRFSDVFVDKREVDSLGRRKTKIVAADRFYNPKRRDYTPEIFLWEINKAFCGFLYHGMDQLVNNNIGVATGDYFAENDPETKAIIMWLAASQAQRPFMAYCTYDDEELQNLGKVSHWILSQRWTVGDLWNKLIDYSTNSSKRESFFQWLRLSHFNTCMQVDPPFAASDICERKRVSSSMKLFLSYLRMDKHSSYLSWRPKALNILQSLKEGQCQSGKQLFSVIRCLRNALGGCDPLSKSARKGFLFFFDLVMSAEESSKWFNEVVPALAKLLLDLPSLLEAHYQNANIIIPEDGAIVSTSLRILETQQPGLVCLSQELIAALLGCSLFCLLPVNSKPVEDLPTINFDQLFEIDFHGLKRTKQLNKIWCIIHYFERITSDMPKGVVSFERRVLPLENDSSHISYSDANFWSDSAIPLCKFTVHTSGLIEDQSSEVAEVYFAGKNLGGDALAMGTSQEEIRFMLSPELIAGRLFLPAMKDNEAIEIVGMERFLTYTGYESSFRYSDAYVDKTDVDTLGRRKTRIVAVDELCVPEMSECTTDIFLCEINKAFCGFLNHGKDQGNNIGVATGARVFGKEPEIKAIIQWLAASQAQRPFIAYCTFGLETLQNLDKVALWISSQSWTVGFLWNELIKYSSKRSKGDTFFQWLQRSHGDGDFRIRSCKRFSGGFTKKKSFLVGCNKRKRSQERDAPK